MDLIHDSEYTTRTNTLLKKFIWGILLITFAIDVYILFSIFKSKSRVEENAQISTEKTAEILEQYIEGNIRQIDISLQTIADEIPRLIKENGSQKKPINNFIQRHFLLLPGVDSIRFANTIGDVLYGTSVEEESSVSVADREYFSEAMASKTSLLVASKPVMGKISQKWVIVFARKVLNSNGVPLGIIYAPVALETFHRFFSNLSLHQNGALNLHDQDFNIIVNFPGKITVFPHVYPFQKNELYDLVEKGFSKGTALIPSPYDHVLRRYSFRRLNGLPFYVSAGVSVKEYLQEWKDDSLKDILGLIVFNVLAFALSMMIFRAWKVERKNIQKLEEQKIKFNTIADYTFNWDFWLSPEKKFVFTSPSCMRITGWSANEFYQNPELLVMLIHPDDKSLFLQNLNCDFAKNPHSKTQMTLRFFNKSGDLRWSEYLSYPIFDNRGHFLGIRGSFRDMTEWKKLEDDLRFAKETAEKANQFKTNFLSNTSHEIRTPLNSIMGLIDILLETSLKDEQRDYVERIERAGETLLDLINQTLELSRIESGILSIENSTFSLPLMISDTIDLLKPKAQKNNLQLKLEIDKRLEKSFFNTDKLKLRQTLVNLISNAIKFTKQGCVLLAVGPYHSAEYENALYFKIQDTGIGIPKEKMELLFKRFSQITNFSNDRLEGTGLGLNICHQLVELMKGKIWVTSEEGVGTTFHFVLPNLDTNSSLPVEKMAQVTPEKNEVTLQKSKILLADDSEENKKLIFLFMKDYPIEIHAVSNGLEAYDEYQREEFDLVLMDIMMPGIDGLEATKMIRDYEKRKGKKNTPIIALTAFGLNEEKEKCLNAGCNKHLSKPIRKQVLIKEIFDILKKSSGTPTANS